MRAIFLFVGQGESTLLFMPDGDAHKTMLVDCNRAPKLGGIDLPKLLADLPTRRDDGTSRLDLFVNTHPHNDHVCGIGDIHKATYIEELWHSGHKPSNHHEGPYKDLMDVVKAVRSRGGNIEELRGSRTATPFASGFIDVVAPAEHVCEDIAGEDPEVRDRRIHEHCSVLRVRYADGAMRGLLLTGDSDKTAWKEHITEYHGKDGENRISSSVLSASHHGSRTFFKDTEDDEDVYEEHMHRIKPEYVVLSAPDRKDSQHDHPHEDAVALYEKHVTAANVLHMGSRRWSFVLDVKEDGSFSIMPDRGELAEKYGLKEDSTNDSNNSSGGRSPIVVIPRVEQSRPMGSR
jgi:beta-lactamase superfamily II metal-dependent hydrolase